MKRLWCHNATCRLSQGFRLAGEAEDGFNLCTIAATTIDYGRMPVPEAPTSGPSAVVNAIVRKIDGLLQVAG